MKIKDLINNEKPREKLKLYGVKYLSNSELLAILLRTGNKNESVLELSNRVLKEVGSINNLSHLTLSELSKIEGIKLSKASIILCAFELSRRINNIVEKDKINNTFELYSYIKNYFSNEVQEMFCVLLLDAKLNILGMKELFKGTLDSVEVHPREIFKIALKENAHSIILIHNHPSGNAMSSQIDDETTNKLVLLGKELGIPVRDHIIIGKNDYFSYYENMKKNENKT